MFTTACVQAPSRASDSCCPIGESRRRRLLSPGRSHLPARTGSQLRIHAGENLTAVRLGFIGAGNYATSMLLPHLRDSSQVELVSVATTKSLSGLNAQRKFGFSTITTSVESVLDDDTLDAVFIVTRHHSHAHLVCQALERGLTVFVEKPLALTEEQLTRVLDTVEKTGNSRVMVGFNRRFAPLFSDLQSASAHSLVRCRPAISSTQASWPRTAGISMRNWKGRGSLGRADTSSTRSARLVGHDPVEVHAMGAAANVQASLRFADDSVATISYMTDGSSRFPKETLDVVGDGRNGRLDNFQRVTVWSAKGKSGHRVLTGQDKGQRAQLDGFVQAVRTGSSMPIALESLAATTRATLAVAGSLSSGRPVTW